MKPTAPAELPRKRFALLFAVMLVAASGNTALQSLLPSIGRELGVPDLLVALTFSLSALLWVVSAPWWARQSDRRGRRALMRLGLAGFSSSMLLCGAVLAAGLTGLLAPVAAFVIFIAGRSLYGWFGSAAQPAVQAYVAARTEGEQRTNALAALASSFGLGTIIGPAIAPLFIFGPLGLASPLIVFGIGGILAWLAVMRGLPDDAPRAEVHGQLVEEPLIGGASPGSGLLRADEEAAAAVADARVWPWLLAGNAGNHGNAILISVIGFLVIDRLALPVRDAQHSIAYVLMAGAGAALLAQWWLIPQLKLSPRALVIWGSILAAAGSALTGLAPGQYATTLGFALASMGFGLFRPGFTSGASLAVEPEEQNAVAGMVTSVNGLAYIAAPALGIALYEWSRPLPFLAVAVLMAGLALWTGFSLRPSHREA